MQEHFQNHFLVNCIVIFYLLFWPIRFNGCFRRARQLLPRGQERFFDVPVPDGSA
jgi:hypothetical protein